MPGERDSITRTDVARSAGVSESTVSRALSDSPLISSAIKERIRGVSESLGYIPNRQAALLSRNRTYRLGLVVRSYGSFPPFSRSYFPRLLDGAVQRAEELGYSITIILDSAGGDAKDLSLPVRGKDVDALIFSVTPLRDPRLAELKKKQVPFVLVNNRRKGFHCVDCDAEGGMRMAFQHARDLGHQRIAYVSGDISYWDGRHRLAVFRKLSGEFAMNPLIVPGDFSMSRGRNAAREIFDRRDPPTLVMCASDRTALGVLRYCREYGIDVPGDVSLIGFDDLDPALDSVPPLTTVRHPVSRMGEVATDLIIDQLEGRPTGLLRVVESDFIIRQSTGRNPTLVRSRKE